MGRIRISLELVVKYDGSMEEGPDIEELRGELHSRIIDFPNDIRKGDCLPFSKRDSPLIVGEVRHMVSKGYTEIKVVKRIDDYLLDEEEAKKEMKRLKRQYAFITALGRD